MQMLRAHAARYAARVARNKGCYFWTPLYVHVRVRIFAYFMAVQVEFEIDSVTKRFPLKCIRGIKKNTF
jgi:hypothetical protein